MLKNKKYTKHICALFVLRLKKKQKTYLIIIAWWWTNRGINLDISRSFVITNSGLPSLTQFARDTREYVFSHAHTQMNENHMRIWKLAEI